MYLRGSHEELLNVQLVQKQRPPHAVNGHTDVGLAVGDFQKLLDILNVTENNVNIRCILEKQRREMGMFAPQTSESDTTSTSSPMQSMNS